MKKTLKALSLIILLYIVFSLVYLQSTNISFNDNQAKISNLYCKLFKKEQPNTPVIFIPGIKGSTLNKNGTQVWLTLKQELFNTKPFIYSENDNIVADGVYTRSVILPYIYEYKPYYYTSAQLACSSNSYFYYYDWRGNPIQNAKNLENLIDRVTHETNQKPTLIGHSMGGLLTQYVIIDKPDSIKKAIYISAPFEPGIDFMLDILNGSETGLNKTILNKTANISQYSSFTLLPHKGNQLYKNQDLLDIKTWENGLYKELNIENTSIDQIREKIQTANDFHSILDKPVTNLPESLYIYSDCIDTPYQIENDKISNKPGDGRVAAISAIPRNINVSKHETYTSCLAHDAQLNNPDIYKKIIDFTNQN